MAPSDENKKTLEAYQSRAKEYIVTTSIPPRDNTKQLIDHALTLGAKNPQILEIGSGAGRDAAYFYERGYEILCTDAVPDFLDHLKDKKYHARLLNILTDPIAGSFDMVYANSVLIHFTHEQLVEILNKIHVILKDGGLFVFSLKQGEGDSWSKGRLGALRYYKFWSIEQIKELLLASQYQIVEISDNIMEDDNNHWIWVIARKIQSHTTPRDKCPSQTERDN